MERVEKKRGKKKETREDEVRGRARLQRHELNGKMKTQDVIAEDIKNGKKRRKRSEGERKRGRDVKCRWGREKKGRWK